MCLCILLKILHTHFIVLVLLQLRRERIAERIRQLQDLVPSVNKVGICVLRS